MPHPIFNMHRFKSTILWLFFFVALFSTSQSKRVYAVTCANIGTANNPYTTAAPITPPTLINETACPSGQYTDAWYKFTVALGNKVTVRLVNLVNDLDIILYDNSLDSLGMSSRTGVAEEKVEYTASGTGTLFIAVHKIAGTITGNYTLIVNTGTQGSVLCNSFCTDDWHCSTNFCHPTEHKCRSSGAGCADSTTCTCTVAINGGWCDFGTCSAATCGALGVQTRACECPTPANGGASCSGSNTQSCRGCNCTPVNGYWTPCSSWGLCSGAACNGNNEPTPGIQTCLSGRTCVGQACGGAGCDPTTQPSATRACYPTNCPYQYPNTPELPKEKRDYQNYCVDTATTKWYAGDPNPLALICIVVRLLNVLVLAVGAIFVMFVFMSAIKFAMAQGDPKALQGAKQGLTVAIIGVLIVVGVFAILTILRNVLGLKYQLLTNPFDVLSDNFAKFMLNLNISW